MNKTILVIAAHPDDEVLGCGGTMMRHSSEGDKVYIVFMTDGVSSRHGVTENEKNHRMECAIKSSKILKTNTPIFLNFPDNRMDEIPLLDIVKSIENLVYKISPDIIYTHHVGDLNIDHQITHKSVITACRPQPGLSVKEIYAFEVLSSTEWQTSEIHPFAPNVYINIEKFIKFKSMSLRVYSGEMRQPPHSRSVHNSIRLNRLRGNFVGMESSEAFVLIRKLYI